MRRSALIFVLTLLLVTSLQAQQPAPRKIIGTSDKAQTTAPRLFGTLLYDQTADLAEEVLLSQYETDDEASEFHSQAADDFVVPVEGWQLGGVYISGKYFAGSSGKADSVDITIYADMNGLPNDAAIACQYLNYSISQDFAGDLSLELDPVCNLSAGIYWLSVVVNMPYQTNGQFGWQSRTETSGSVAVWRNPGNGYDTGCTDWSLITACLVPEGETIEDDLAFQLYAASIPDPICTASTLIFEDDHEDGFDGWTVAQGEGNNPWVGKTDGGYSQNNYWFVANIDPAVEATDSYLTSQTITIPAGASSVFLRFYHKYMMELKFDGGVVEISVNGGEFTDIGDDKFIQNGYNLDIVPLSTSPLAGRRAFTGTETQYVETIATLNVVPGDGVAVRFRQANDDLGNEFNGGWWVDDVQVGYCTTFATETPAPTWTSTPTLVSETATPDRTVDVTATPHVTLTPTASPTIEAGLELLENGGFEEVDTTQTPILNPWTVKNVTGDKIKCNKYFEDRPDKIFAHTGNCAFQLKGGVVEASSLRQDVELTGLTFTANSSLNLSVFAKATNAAASAKIKLRVTYTDRDEKGKLNIPVLQTADYTKLPDSLPLLSANVEKIKVQISNRSTAGKIFIDDVTLQLVEGASLLPLP